MSKTGQNNVCAVIPAAGRSSRMRSFKPLLRFDEDRTFIEKIVGEFLDFGCSEIVIIVNDELYEQAWDDIFSKLDSGVSVIINDQLSFERYYSIKLGLQSLQNCEYCFIHNCDNPFVDQKIITALFKNKIGNGYVSPTFNKQGGHPILISEPIIKSIIHSKGNDSNFRDVLNPFTSKKISIDTQDILANINTELQYQQFADFKQLLIK
jgi:molybdenum cofactor cytidylyltransferase